MNKLKEQLQGKLEFLKKGEILYYHDPKSETYYAFLAALTTSNDRAQELLSLGPNVSLLTADSFAPNVVHSMSVNEDSTVLQGDFSSEGLLALAKSLSLGDVLQGNDRIMMRIVKAKNLLKDESVEGRLVEFLSNIEGSENCLLYTRMTAAPDGANEDRVVSDDDVALSRFFNPRLIQMTGVTELDLQQGKFNLYSFYSELDRRYHWAFVYGDLENEQRLPLVRVESECLTGHVFGSLLCDCGDQLSKGLEEVAEYGYGALVYLRQEGRGIGLKAKLEAYYLQQVHGMDTVDANIAVGMPEDARDYIIGAQILNYLKFDPLQLLTNNPAKICGLERYGLKVDQRVSHIIPPSDLNKKYLDTKRDRMGHRI